MIKENDKGKAGCHKCKDIVSVTYKYMDLPFSDGRGTVKDLLVGVCNICGSSITIPNQETGKIKMWYN